MSFSDDGDSLLIYDWSSLEVLELILVFRALLITYLNYITAVRGVAIDFGGVCHVGIAGLRQTVGIIIIIVWATATPSNFVSCPESLVDKPAQRRASTAKSI